MRQYIRSWINEWDLRRLDPAYNPQTAIETIGSDYTEDEDLISAGDGDPADAEEER
jgi:hypothetical protein